MGQSNEIATACAEHDGKLLSLFMIIMFVAGCALGVGLTLMLGCE